MPELPSSLNSVLKYFETETDAIAIADRDLKLVWFNQKFKDLFSRKRLKGHRY
jgi:hypothetical protein